MIQCTYAILSYWIYGNLLEQQEKTNSPTNLKLYSPPNVHTLTCICTKHTNVCVHVGKQNTHILYPLFLHGLHNTHHLTIKINEKTMALISHETHIHPEINTSMKTVIFLFNILYLYKIFFILFEYKIPRTVHHSISYIFAKKFI